MKLFTLSYFCVLLIPLSFCQGQERITLDVQDGSGSGSYGTKESIQIAAPKQPGKVFTHWSGGSGFIKDVYSANTIIEMPQGDISIRAMYRDEKSSGIADIDALRKRIKTDPTNDANYYDRRAVLVRWWRLLWRQGYDVSSFDQAGLALNVYENDPSQGKSQVDHGFHLLETIFAQDLRIEEISSVRAALPTSKTNWPFYMGIDGLQQGFSPDEGPSRGKIAWRFPKHHKWVVKPVVEDGRVYLSSPGTDVVGYCLDEVSGEEIWRVRQYGFDTYSTPGAKVDPIVGKNKVLFRSSYGARKGIVVNKSTGLRTAGTTAEARPGSSSEKQTIVYRRWNELVFASEITLDPIQSVNTKGKLLGEPASDGEFVYAITQQGKLSCHKRIDGTSVWETQVQQAPRGGVSICRNRLLVGTKDEELLAFSKTNGKSRWTFRPDEQESRAYQFFSGCVEANGRVYVGGASGYLYCLDAKSGKLVWKQRASDWIRSRPLIVNGIVYVATLDGNLFAYRDHGDRCEELWRTHLNDHGFEADLEGTSQGILASGRDLILYSVSTKTGNLQWRRGIVDGAWIDGVYYMAGWTGGLMTTPVVYDDVVYVGGPDGFVNALDVESGRELWRFETSSATSAAPSVIDGKVFIGQLSGMEYWALDKDTGEPIWESNYPRTWVGAAIGQGKIVLGDMEGYIFGVDPDDGRMLWKYDTAEDTPKAKLRGTGHRGHGFPPGVYSNPVSDGETVYSGSWSGLYFALDPSSGDLKWRTSTSTELDGGLPDSAAPMLLGNYLYVQKLGSVIAALDKRTGKIDWEWSAPVGYLQNGTVAGHDGKIFGSCVRNALTIPYQATIVAFDCVEKGSQKLWEYPHGGGITAPVVTKGTLITGSTADVFVSCLNSEDGSLIWRVFIGGEMLENVPAIYGDKVFVHAKNGYIFAIE